MDFEFSVDDYRPLFDLVQIIYASGTIEKGDAAKFEQLALAHGLIAGAHVYLDTMGGDFFEGIELGRVIYKLGFSTNVGRRKDNNSAPAVCASAGVWAYLGGRFRYLRDDSQIGVHQFFGEAPNYSAAEYLSLGQLYSGSLIDYIVECRVDTKLFSLMSATFPERINFISREQLTDLNVVTGDIFELSWDFQFVSGVPYLRGYVANQRGEHKMLFMPTPTGELLITVFFGHHERQPVIDYYKSLAVFLDDDMLTIPQEDVGVPPHEVGDFVSYIFGLPLEVAERMLKCREVGAAIVPDLPGIYSGFHIKLGYDGRVKLQQVIDTCRANKTK